VLVVVVARDYLLDERPGWGKGVPDAVTIRLEPLSATEGRELAIVAGERVDEQTADRIATHAGGNPFFIVETTGMLIQEHPDHAEGTPHSHLLPPTVQAVVASRIDHLSEDARDLIRKASVFAGSSFDRSDLQVVAQPNDELIQALEDAELLVRDNDRPGTWRFRHEMLREVAYESLPKRERRRLHLAVAEALLAADENRNRGAVAFHLEQAARAGLDLDPGDRSLADRAVEALTEAGDRARWRIESRAALDLYERALALAGPEEQWNVREARILSRMGEARYWLGEFEQAASVLERALELGGEDPWTQAHASRFLGDIELNVRASPDRAEALVRRALDASRALGDPYAESRTLIMGGWVHFWRGDSQGARAMFEEGLSIARSNPEGDRWAEARALTSLASVISGIGDERECLALAEQALALGREMHDPFTQAVAQEYIGNSLRRMGMLQQAMDRLDAAVRTFRDLDARWELASSLTDRGFVRRLLGNMASAEEDLRQAVRMCKELGERNLITWSAERLVRVLVERGDPVEARKVLTEVEMLLDLSDRGARMSLLGSEIEILLGEGDRDGARKLGDELLSRYREAGPSNEAAGMTWWMARVFGPEAAGGEAAALEARRTLEAAHWNQALTDPDLFVAALRERGLEVVPAP
jgi:tetratricopeptide (TPR) repeat protein